MRTHRIFEHPNEEALLAYVDGELSGARLRAIRNHLTSCWTCRSVLADLESQAEAISRLLSDEPNSNIDRSIRAKEKFLAWRASFEGQRKFLFRKRHPILLPGIVRLALAHGKADRLLSKPI
jgi:anti-sigma factor RsiW